MVRCRSASRDPEDKCRWGRKVRAKLDETAAAGVGLKYIQGRSIQERERERASVSLLTARCTDAGAGRYPEEGRGRGKAGPGVSTQKVASESRVDCYSTPSTLRVESSWDRDGMREASAVAQWHLSSTRWTDRLSRRLALDGAAEAQLPLRPPRCSVDPVGMELPYRRGGSNVAAVARAVAADRV